MLNFPGMGCPKHNRRKPSFSDVEVNVMPRGRILFDQSSRVTPNVKHDNITFPPSNSSKSLLEVCLCVDHDFDVLMRFERILDLSAGISGEVFFILNDKNSNFRLH